jgi:hypothetical protein
MTHGMFGSGHLLVIDRQRLHQFHGVDAFSESQMSQASQVQEHMDVISSDLKTVGKVDHLDGPDTATLMADAAVRLKGAVRLPAKQPSAVRA